RDAFSKMKDGAYIVNTARGPLIDTEAMIDSLENGKLAGAALDVVEGEFGLYYNDCGDMDLSGTYMDRLRKMDNVMITHHMAFYYDAAVRDMVHNSLLGMRRMADGEEIPYRLV
ncbi:MAG: NAD(P)-dependent oxidoreductase, partial [Candidatus Methanomethylophilaceae archaeon]